VNRGDAAINAYWWWLRSRGNNANNAANVNNDGNVNDNGNNVNNEGGVRPALTRMPVASSMWGGLCPGVRGAAFPPAAWNGGRTFIVGGIDTAVKKPHFVSMTNETAVLAVARCGLPSMRLL
jgi:hypothetical protein